MKILRGAVFTLIFFASLPAFAFQKSAEPAEEQDFLFLLDEAYTQRPLEIQVNTGFEFLKNKKKEQEFEGELDEDTGEIERDHETGSERTQKLAMPLEIEIGILDGWEMEVETQLLETNKRSAEFSRANTKKRETEGGFGDLEYGNNFRLIQEGGGWVPAVTAGMAFVFPTSSPKERELAHKRTGYEWVLKTSKTFRRLPFPGALIQHTNLGFGVTPRVQAVNDGLEDSKPHDLREIHYGWGFVWQLPEHWSWMLELRHEFEEEIELNSRVTESELVLLPGFSFRSEIAEKLEWEWGAGFPVGLTPDAEDWGFVIKLKLEA